MTECPWLPAREDVQVFLFRKSSISFGKSYITLIKKLRNSTTSLASFSPVPFAPLRVRSFVC
jgi:hypothetical protein